MHRIASLLAVLLVTQAHGESEFSLASTPGRLPKEVVPRHYAVSLEPDSDVLTTAGREAIDLEVLRPTDRITLNAVDTEIWDIVLTQGDQRRELQPEFDNRKQAVTFKAPEQLQPGRYQLSFQFRSRIQESPRGLFIQRYQSAGARRSILATQMEPADTRRMFPCWDEPVFRATFQLSVKLPKELTAVSNTEIEKEIEVDQGKKVVVFQRTPSMASYLVVLVLGELEWLEGSFDTVKLRVVTTAGKKELGQYAMEVTKKLLPYFNDYLGVPYPLSKLDQIALPAGFGGAMENWGGITYNESLLLFDPTHSAEETKRKIFSVMAHEIAHQWFGNLVTMAWWDNLWLNEGFASWMETKATDHFNPTWEYWLAENKGKEEAMDLDARPTTHPVQQIVADEEQAMNAFDKITYEKGQAFIRMLENFLGADAFRAGIRDYIRTNAYSNATTTNLWEALEKATGKPVHQLAATWVEQPGFPLIKMTAQCVRGNRVVSLEQGRFVLGKADQAAEQWSVPVGIISTKAPDQIRYALLDKVSNNFDFAGCDGALKGNAGGVGFFRVWYEPILFTELQREVAKLPKADRVSLVVDTWAMVESGRTPAGAYLDLLSNLRDETSLPVWERVIDTLTLIDRLQQGRPGRERFQKFASALIRPQLQRLGWEEKPEDDPQTVLLRGKVIEALGFFGERDVIDESFRRFEAFRKEPASVAPNLRPAVTHIVGRYSSAEAYAQLHTLAKQAELMEEKRMLYRGMQAALDPDLARQTLAITLTDELSVPDANKLIENVATEGEHPDIAWEFAKANLKEFIDRRAFLRRNRFLPAIAEGFSDPEFADELIELTQKHLPDGLPVAERSASLIRHRAELKTGVLPAIDQWIAARSVDGASVRR